VTEDFSQPPPSPTAFAEDKDKNDLYPSHGVFLPSPRT